MHESFTLFSSNSEGMPGALFHIPFKGFGLRRVREVYRGDELPGNELAGVPMEFKTRGGRKEIILPPDAATTADVSPRSPLVVALAERTAGSACLIRGNCPA